MTREPSRFSAAAVDHADRRLLKPLCSDDRVGMRNVTVDEVKDLSDVQSGESNVEE
jgi:hypothetical protein